jgi:hypothetical protein
LKTIPGNRRVNVLTYINWSNRILPKALISFIAIYSIRRAVMLFAFSVYVKPRLPDKNIVGDDFTILYVKRYKFFSNTFYLQSLINVLTYINWSNRILPKALISFIAIYSITTEYKRCNRQ